MEAEVDSLMGSNTFEYCKLPPGAAAIGCRWIYKIKRDEHGHVSRYKARLVAKGYAQRPGVDYSETFAPVPRASTIRLLLSIAAQQDLDVHRWDVSNAFLHADLKEEVYMKPPPGIKTAPGTVCRL